MFDQHTVDSEVVLSTGHAAGAQQTFEIAHSFGPAGGRNALGALPMLFPSVASPAMTRLSGHTAHQPLESGVSSWGHSHRVN